MDDVDLLLEHGAEVDDVRSGGNGGSSGGSGGSGGQVVGHRAELYGDDQRALSSFLREHTCYDLLPLSSKVIIFDTTLEVRYAFYALIQNEIRAAPLWDSEARKIVGMLTVTDFINILRHYYANNWKESIPLEEHQIQTWRQIALHGTEQPLLCANPMESLYSAAKILVKNRIHRLPLIDDKDSAQCCLSVITQLRILHFIACNFKTKLELLKTSVGDLELGTYENIATCSMRTPLIEVLNLFEQRHVSAVPIVDEEGTVLDVYEKFDVSYLAHDKAYENLNMTVRQALEHRQEGIFEGVHTCTVNDTMSSILETIRESVVHRFIVVDNDTKLKGVISVSDILSALLDSLDDDDHHHHSSSRYSHHNNDNADDDV